MDSTTSFVMALVAVIVSGFSAVASFLALGQAARYHPAPFMTARVKGDEKGEASVFLVRVVNMGRAPAHDVQLVVRNWTMGKFAVLWRALEVPVTHPMDARISRVNGESKFDNGGMGVLYPQGQSTPMNMQVELTWRQWPAMKRVRRIRWRVTTDEDGNATLHAGRERGLITTAFAEISQGARDAFSELWATLKGLF